MKSHIFAPLWGMFLLACVSMPSSQAADSTEMAIQMHTRLTGISPSASVLATVKSFIDGGNLAGAANYILSDSGASPNPDRKYFYDLVLKSFFNSWLTVTGAPNAPMTDLGLGFIGRVKFDRPFNGIFNDTQMYTGPLAGITGTVAAYSHLNGQHAIDMENQIVSGSLSYLTDLVETDQNQTLINLYATANAGEITPADISGVFLLRGFGEEFLKDGTNRRVLQWLDDKLLCRPLADNKDNTISDYRVRRDVPRSPNGDSSIYQNTCKGCHAGMDAIMGGFARTEWATTNNQTRVVTNNTNYGGNGLNGTPHKYNRNSNVNTPVIGYQTVDDSWINLWTSGANASFGWDPATPTSGNGMRSFGNMMAKTGAFAECMARRVFKQVCAYDAQPSEQATVNYLKNVFVGPSQTYSMKNLFIAAAALPQCNGTISFPQ